jgi:hypothetical protein
MTLLRKTAQEKAMTGARLRVIRALAGLKGQYTKTELQKPFAVPSVTFSPDYNNPEVRRMMFMQGMNSASSLFGAPAVSSIPAPMDVSEEYVDNNQAFAPEMPTTNDSIQQGEGENWWENELEPAQEAISEPTHPQEEDTGYSCDECGAGINERVYDYSLNKFGRPLCMKCQKNAGK